ncbi:MerR family transcriptional regulator [Bacteroidales bacterium OttesenSCG-928-B11]|nr:MerR family transcriptional regulator [Bacteroidales bacterium OttesenSCG-928-C03]MDL2312034.1 MerR family transcriptional regulator [Bacteroidales bacterium OttesenSCG-928-B11]
MEEIEKVYFSIGETAKMFDVNASLLRYWEKEFDVIKPFKNKKGDRYYTKNDLETIRTIHYLTKIKGYTLQGAKEAMKRNPVQEKDNAYITDTLLKMKNLLLEIKEDL